MRKLALPLAVALAPVAALAATLNVPLDQSAFVTLAAPAHNVIIGNPAIADVSVADQRHVIVTGKGQGVTNLLITDPAGRPIFDRQIVVGADLGGRVTLINGGQIVKYTCAPVCEAAGGSAVSGPAAMLSSLFSAAAGAATEAPRPSISVTASPTTP
jgi:hypothetical protein